MGTQTVEVLAESIGQLRLEADNELAAALIVDAVERESVEFLAAVAVMARDRIDRSAARQRHDPIHPCPHARGVDSRYRWASDLMRNMNFRRSRNGGPLVEGKELEERRSKAWVAARDMSFEIDRFDRLHPIGYSAIWVAMDFVATDRARLL